MMEHKSPILAVDVIIRCTQGIILIERKYPPLGWALPGGHVDYGESCPTAAVREVKEETGLDVELHPFILGVYSKPDRDPRKHVVSVVYVARGKQLDLDNMKAGDDAANVKAFKISKLPTLAFDHSNIIEDYRMWSSGKAYPILER